MVPICIVCCIFIVSTTMGVTFTFASGRSVAFLGEHAEHRIIYTFKSIVQAGTHLHFLRTIFIVFTHMILWEECGFSARFSHCE